MPSKHLGRVRVPIGATFFFNIRLVNPAQEQELPKPLVRRIRKSDERGPIKFKNESL